MMAPLLKTDSLKEFSAALIFESGDYFLGKGIGKEGITTGELCFNTSMSGYQEAITDPSYAGQIITFTFPHIGNVGVNHFDRESNHTLVRGIVIHSLPTSPSSYRSEKDFLGWLKTNKITGICEIDTRTIVKRIRKNEGPIKAAIGFWKNGLTQDRINLLWDQAQQEPGLIGNEFSGEMNLKSYLWEESSWKSSPHLQNKNLKLVVLDFGVKQSILRKLYDLGCEVMVLPGNTSFPELMKHNPHGIVLSNGPGDPRKTYEEIKMCLKDLLEANVPIFGICLGHQMLALAMGGEIKKMECGHHGINHPVMDLRSKRILITSQNHEFVVHFDKSNVDIEISHFSLFDRSIEGFSIKKKPIMAVQFHPEASPGPSDAEYLFTEFLNMVIENTTKTITS